MMNNNSECKMCPRECGVSRGQGKTGYCKETDVIRVGRAALHMWEEPCISGEEGLGTVFFTGCNLGCVFCQNYSLSRNRTGKEVTVERLAEIFMELQEKGANNVNLVTPTHYVPQIIEALKIAKEKGLILPIVYNCGGYESVRTLRSLEGYIDIYLPDFKYWDASIGKRYSMVKDYPDRAREALAEMYRQVGPATYDERGMMMSGVIVRHLVLPGFVEDSKKIVDYIYHTYDENVIMSLMNQYTPLETLDVEKFPELARKITEDEYDELIDYAIDLGIEKAFVQDGETAEESFIPAFTLEGV